MSIEKICKQYGIENYTINDDGSIDVNDDVDLSFKNLTKLPLRFNKVSGWFDCDYNKLTTLKGSPKWVGGYFISAYNNLTSLEFSPEYVGGYFNCSYNKLTDNYCDTEIIGSFYTSLEQDGLIINNYEEATNYKEWRKLITRKIILNKIWKIKN